MRPGAGRREEAQRIEVVVVVGTRQALDDPARLRIGDVQVDAEDPASREEGEALPVGRQRRRDVGLAPPASRGLQHAGSGLGGRRASLDDRCVRRADRGMPFRRDRVCRDTEHATERRLEPLAQ